MACRVKVARQGWDHTHKEYYVNTGLDYDMAIDLRGPAVARGTRLTSRQPFMMGTVEIGNPGGGLGKGSPFGCPALDLKVAGRDGGAGR